MHKVIALLALTCLIAGCFGFRDPAGNEASYTTNKDGSRSIGAKTVSGYTAFAEIPADATAE